MPNEGKKYLDAGACVLSESWQYSFAFAEYTGLVVFSFIKKGSSAVGSVIGPVTDAAGPGVFAPVRETSIAAFEKTMSGLSNGWSAVSASMQKLFVCRSKRLETLEGRLTQLEERLSYLEKHGIIATKEGLSVKGKKLTEDRLAFLKNIVNENIDLMVEDTNGQ